MRLDIDRNDLAAAAQQGLLDEEHVETLWMFLQERVASDGHVRISPASGVAERVGRAGPLGKLSFVHVLWFGGALLVLGAMTFFATVGFTALGPSGLAVIAAVYGYSFFAVGRTMWQRPEMKVFGGLCITLAVGMVPLATFALQKATGLWGAKDPGAYRDFFFWVRGGWFMMEVTTVVASLAALARFRFSFLVVIPSVALWFMSMDLTAFVVDEPSAKTIGWMSVVFGVGMVVVGWLLRRRDRADLSYWLETFALVSLQGGLMVQSSDMTWTKIVFAAVQIGILHLSRVWQRRWPLLVSGLGLLSLFGDRFAATPSDVMAIGFTTGAMLFGYGFWVRRSGVSPTAMVAFLFVPIYALALPWHALHDDVLGRFGFGAVALFVIALAVIARSRLLVAGGGLALAALIGELAFNVFKDSMVFPLVLASIGIGVMLLGVLLQKKQAHIDAALNDKLPVALRLLRVPR